MFTDEKFNTLQNIKKSEYPCVSIFIPTYRAGKNQEDKLRLKNALSEAVSQLTDERLFPERTMEKQVGGWDIHCHGRTEVLRISALENGFHTGMTGDMISPLTRVPFNNEEGWRFLPDDVTGWSLLLSIRNTKISTCDETNESGTSKMIFLSFNVRISRITSIVYP